MDSASADAQTALGSVLFRSERTGAPSAASIARWTFDPNHTEALLEYGALNDALGNGELGLRLKQQALASAPSSPLVLIEVALSYAHLRKFDEAIVWTRKARARHKERAGLALPGHAVLVHW